MFAAWSRVRRSKQPAACARKVLFNRHLSKHPVPDGLSRHASLLSQLEPHGGPILR
jgi:hypothetical protein